MVYEVAVKSSVPGSVRTKLLQEAVIMAQFGHPNVLQLYGVVLHEKTVHIPTQHTSMNQHHLCRQLYFMQVMLVVELARNGDLQKYLRSLKQK